MNYAEQEQGKADFSRVNLSGKRTTIAGEEKIRIGEFSEKGQADKFPLKNGDLFT